MLTVDPKSPEVVYWLHIVRSLAESIQQNRNLLKSFSATMNIELVPQIFLSIQRTMWYASAVQRHPTKPYKILRAAPLTRHYVSDILLGMIQDAGHLKERILQYVEWNDFFSRKAH